MTRTASPYRQWVGEFARLLAQPPAEPSLPAPMQPQARPAGSRTALIFAPHPDDEVIMGGLPLRLLRELGAHVVNVAVTLGSRSERRAERWLEVRQACDHLGFTLTRAAESGLDVDPDIRAHRPRLWRRSVMAIADILARHRPEVVFVPHGGDWHPKHIGTHYLVLDALSELPESTCRVVETEFWATMTTPNLMVESGEDDVADLVMALSLHVGETARNPYHLRFPAWMMDNVRRGAELVGHAGDRAPPFAFATLYRLSRWCEGRLHQAAQPGRILSRDAGLDELFEP